MNRPPLPDFVRPPITEVALSMQFEELSSFRVIHLGLLWEAFGGKQAFPVTEEQLPVPPTLEKLGAHTQPLMPQIQLVDMPLMPRYLFLDQTGNTVLQIQRDRFTVNWRKRATDDEYPRFESILGVFEKYANAFAKFLDTHNLGKIRVTQAEVTYVNRIETAGVPGKIEKIVSVFSGNYSDGFLHDPEEVHLALRFPMVNDDRVVGRLHIDSRPGISGDSKSPINMVLLARGKPEGDDINATLRFFEIARTHIVSAFASVTSKQMHVSWERTDNA